MSRNPASMLRLVSSVPGRHSSPPPSAHHVLTRWESSSGPAPTGEANAHADSARKASTGASASERKRPSTRQTPRSVVASVVIAAARFLDVERELLQGAAELVPGARELEADLH